MQIINQPSSKMLRVVLFLFFSLGVSEFCGQTKIISLEGEWMVKDLSNSVVRFYKGTDGYWYSTIVRSDNAVYVNQVIYKGKIQEGHSYLEGTFITPKSKMNISTKVYLDNEQEMRFVGKKFFITKTYSGKRIK